MSVETDNNSSLLVNQNATAFSESITNFSDSDCMDPGCSTYQNNNVSKHQSDSAELESSSTPKMWLFTLTRNERLILCSLIMMDLLTNTCLSIMAPIFPAEAEKRGVSDILSGFIFAVYPLTQFLFSPVCGHLILHVGPSFMLMSGQFIGGGCSILFGILAFMAYQQQTEFIVYCFVLRIVMAMGTAAADTASFAILAARFPSHISSAFGLIEMAVGVGQTLGPAMGGFLTEASGYYLPFVVTGALMVVTVPLYMYILRTPTQSAVEDEKETRQPYTVFTLLRVPTISVVCVAIVVACLMWSILDPTLEPHLSTFNLAPSLLGLVFLFMSTFYAISSPIWGWLCDKLNNSSLLLVGAFVFASVGLLLLGPSPLLFLGDYNVLWLNLVALAILGTAASLAAVPTFDKILVCAEQAGLDDSVTVQALAGGLWSSCYAFGDFIGPSLGGFLLDSVGFGWTVTIVAGVCLLMGLVVFVMWLCERPATPAEDNHLLLSVDDGADASASDAA